MFRYWMFVRRSHLIQILSLSPTRCSINDFSAKFRWLENAEIRCVSACSATSQAGLFVSLVSQGDASRWLIVSISHLDKSSSSHRLEHCLQKASCLISHLSLSQKPSFIGLNRKKCCVNCNQLCLTNRLIKKWSWTKTFGPGLIFQFDLFCWRRTAWSSDSSRHWFSPPWLIERKVSVSELLLVRATSTSPGSHHRLGQQSFGRSVFVS